MAIRADQVFMLAVVGLGGYAVYRLVTAKPPGERLPPDVPILNGGEAATTPTGTRPVDILGNLALEPSMPVGRSAWYWGRIELPNVAESPRAGLSVTSTDADVAAAVRAMGFDRVEVHPTPESAARRINTPQALAEPTGSSKWFFARFAAPGQARARIPRPPWLTILHVTATPTMAEQPPALRFAGAVYPFTYASLGAWR